MRPSIRWSFAPSWLALLLAGMALAGCATTATPGVHVAQARPVALAQATPIVVQAPDTDSGWAARAALREAGWPLALPAQPGAVVLRTYLDHTRHTQLVRPDPFCDPRGWHPYGWTPYSHWGGFYGDCRTVRRSVPVRTLTWALESTDGRVLWYASAREAWPMGPPLALSHKLARALNAWQTTAGR